MKIVPKLNLNKVPQTVESGNLVLSKNVKVTQTKVIERDNPMQMIFNRTITITNNDDSADANVYGGELLGKIIGINHKIYFFIKQLLSNVYNITSETSEAEIVNLIKNDLSKNNDNKKSYESYTLEYKGIISENGDNDIYDNITPGPIKQDVIHKVVGNEIYDRDYIIPSNSNISSSAVNYKYYIIEYNEESGKLTTIKTAWTWGGGDIQGCVINNNTGEDILVIAESNIPDNREIPIKFINLTEGKYSENDDESIYTQTPKIPITNLKVVDYVNGNIPTGVYQFFIRYEINDYLHTAWFPCTGDIFSYDKKKDVTIQGSIIHIESLDVSSRTFKLSVEHLLQENKSLYIKFQLGFILSHKDAIIAREWKHFDINTESITFDYSQDDIVEANVDDFITPQFNIYNPKNVIYFKNRLYCSNYKTFDYDKNLIIDDDTKNAIDIGIGPNATAKYKSLEIPVSGSNLYIGNIPIIEDDGNIIVDSTKSTMTHNQFINYITELRFISESVQTYSRSYERTNKTTLEHGLVDSTKKSISPNISDIHKYNISPTQIDEETIDNYDEQNNTFIHIDCNPIVQCKYVYNGTKTNLPGYTDKLDKYEASSDETLLGNTLGDNQNGNLQELKDKLVNVTKDGQFKIQINNQDTDVDYFEVAYVTDFKINIKQISDKTTGISEPWLTILTNIIYASLGGDLLSWGANPWTAALGALSAIIREKLNAQYYQNYKLDVTYKLHKVKVYPVLKYNVINNYKTSFLYHKTLVPNCTYSFYIHYVTDKGFVTNGYYLKTQTLNTLFDYGYDNTKVYYPALNVKNIRIPIGFAAAFISVYKHPVTSCELTNIKLIKTNITPSGTTYTYTGECFELDSLLVKGLTNIAIANNLLNADRIITKDAVYYSSNTTTPLSYFSNYGVIEWTETDNIITYPYSRYALFDYYEGAEIYDLQEKEYKQLTRITPIFNNASIITYEDFNLPGYLCEVKKLDELTKTPLNYVTSYTNVGNIPSASKSLLGTIIKYTGTTSGSFTQNKYYKCIENSGNYEWSETNITDNTKLTIYTDGNTVGYLNIEEYNVNDTAAVTLDTELFDSIGARVIGTESPHYIRSCFNLNCLSIIEDMDILVKIITPESKDEEGKRQKQVLPLVPSLQVSNLLTLTKTFKEYTRKTYSIRRDDNITKFDNTLIASNPNIDEEYQYIFTFLPTDYYNIPTNRGPIVKLMSVANTLYAHCTQSLFKFNSNPQLTTQEDQVGLEERDVFITGCTAVYDSIYGYGGLDKASHSIVTFDSYIFYDKYVNTIYAFDGNNIQSITEPVREVLRHFKPTDVIFGYDYANRRLFINLIKETSEERNNICLSFSFIMKDIVALHDMDYKESFCTRIGCYFLDWNTTKLMCYRTSETFDESVYLLSDDYDPTEDAIARQEEYIREKINSIADFTEGTTDEEILQYIKEQLDTYNINTNDNPIYVGYCKIESEECSFKDGKYYNFIDNEGELLFELIEELESFILDNAIVESVDYYKAEILAERQQHYNDYKDSLIEAGIYTDENLYGILTKQSFMPNSPIFENAADNIIHNIEKNPSVIDVIFTEEYEKIKVLNAVSWVNGEIKDFFSSAIPNADYVSELFCADRILIYSDQCYTPLYLITHDVESDYNMEKTSYMPSHKPVYNCGVWTMNNFRDVKNVPTTNNIPYDNESLIYGKYIVVRFVFDKKNFRLENVIFNTQDYEKV